MKINGRGSRALLTGTPKRRMERGKSLRLFIRESDNKTRRRLQVCQRVKGNARPSAAKPLAFEWQDNQNWTFLRAITRTCGHYRRQTVTEHPMKERALRRSVHGIPLPSKLNRLTWRQKLLRPKML